MRGALADVSNAVVEEDRKGTRVSRASAEDAGAKGKRRADAAEPGAARGDARTLVSALMAGAEHQAEPAGTSANPDDAGYAALVGEAIGEIPESAIPKVKAVLQKTLSDVKKREDELEAKRLANQANGTTLERMIAEARDWTGGRVSEDTLRRLLEHMRLKKMQSKTEDEYRGGDRADHYTKEGLSLAVELPARWAFENPVELGSVSERVDCIVFHVIWLDLFNDDSIAGLLNVSPFLKEDPEVSKKKFAHIADDDKRRMKEIEAVFEKARDIRQKWHTKVPKGELKEKAGDWMRGVGLRPKDIAWEDAARAVCAGIGMLARDAPDNDGQFVFKRVMTLLERHLKALNNPCAPDPDAPDVMDRLRTYGGVLTSTPVLAHLARQDRWNRSKAGVKRKLATGGAGGGSDADGASP